MAKTPDPKLSLLHRDRGVGSADADAPQAPRHETHSGETLAAALRNVEKGSDAERALLEVVGLLMARQGSGGDGGGADMRRLVTRLGGVIIAVLALVQPVAEQVSERWLSPSSAIERKIDQVIATQATQQQKQHEQQVIFIALAKWVVECQVAVARVTGTPLPEPPAPVRLLLVQDELHSSTGP